MLAASRSVRAAQSVSALVVTLRPTLAPELRQGRKGETDAHLVDLWLHGRTPHTQRAYRADVDRFPGVRGHAASECRPRRRPGVLRLTGRPGTQLEDAHNGRGEIATRLRPGYLPLNVGAAVKLQQSKNTLAERILSEPRCMPRWRSSPGAGTRCCCGCCTSQACACRRSSNSSGATCSRERTVAR